MAVGESTRAPCRPTKFVQRWRRSLCAPFFEGAHKDRRQGFTEGGGKEEEGRAALSGTRARSLCDWTTRDTCAQKGWREFASLAAARTQATAIRNFAVEYRKLGILAGLTDVRVQ